MRRPERPSTASLSATLGLLAVLLLPGCATVAPAPPPEPPPPAVADPSATGEAAAEMPPGLHWARNSAEARALYLQTYQGAGEELADLVADRAPFTWAVVIDADETLVDNSQYQKERALQGLGFTYDSWHEWVRREEATALPGAREFLESVRGLGGKVAVVTNRSVAVCGPTESNLRKLRLAFDVVLCKPLEGPSDKAPRWQAVEEGTASRSLPPLEIVMWVGDNIQDFPGGSQALAAGPEGTDPDMRRLLARFGDDFFILPNPMYGSWEDNPPN